MRYRQRCQTARRVHGSGLLSRFRENKACHGQVLVEFTMVAIVFFLLMFALIDFSWLMFNQMNMQDAVREAARYASTGNYVPNPTNPNPTVDRNASITKVLYQFKEGANIESLTIASLSNGVVTSNYAGGPNDTVTITAVCDVPLLTSAIGSLFGTDNKFHFTVSSTFKNEPFPQTPAN